MIPLNIPTFDFRPPKIFLRLLIPPKSSLHEISPYRIFKKKKDLNKKLIKYEFLCFQCLKKSY